MALSKTTLNRIIFILVTVMLVSAVVYSYRLSEVIQRLQQNLTKSEQERIGLKISLEHSRDRIQAQQQMYAALAQEKEALRLELDDFNVRVLQLQELLSKEKQANEALLSDHEQLHQEISTLQGEIRLWEGKITSLDEVDAVVAKRTESKRELQKNIHALRAALQKEKQRIQAEINRIQLENGNRGYMMKNGEPTFTSESAVELERIIIRQPAGR